MSGMPEPVAPTVSMKASARLIGLLTLPGDRVAHRGRRDPDRRGRGVERAASRCSATGATSDARGGRAGRVDDQVDGDRVAPVALGVLGVDPDRRGSPRRGRSTTAAGIVASRLATGAVVVDGHRRRRCRRSPWVSMKYSAAAMLVLPEAESSPVAATRPPASAPLVSGGVSSGATAWSGHPTSAPLTSTELNGPQLPGGVLAAHVDARARPSRPGTLARHVLGRRVEGRVDGVHRGRRAAVTSST